MLREVQPGETPSAAHWNELTRAVKRAWESRGVEPYRLHKAMAGWVLTGGQWVEIFYDDFNTENGGSQASNWTGWLNWTVTPGYFMDLIASTPGNPTGGDGLFVDLQGSTGNTTPGGDGYLSEFQTDTTWTDRGRYRLSFRLGGSQRTANSTVRVRLGTALDETLTLASADDWADYTYTFRINGDGGSIRFNNETINQTAGTVDRGAILDNVRLEIFQ